MPFPWSDPPKTKICLCICLSEGLFFIISSKPYRGAPADSQVTIFKEELECLSHDSSLDTSKAYVFDARSIEKAAKGGIFRLNDSALARVRHAVASQRYLPEAQKRLVIENL